MESSGPEIKVRGPASHIYERYLQLSRDAAGAGDRVLSENYAQHADHYFRLVRSMQPATPPPPPQNFNEGEFEGEEGAAEGPETSSEVQAGGEDGGEQPDVDFPSGEQQQQFNRERGEGGDRGRRRGRRNRYRGDGERGEGEARAEGGEARDDEGGGEQRAERQDRAERPERQERRERQPREREEPAGPEGFSSGPKPAFLRDN